MKSFLTNLTKRIIVCPNCGKRSRVPIKPGKVLRVVCPSCQQGFEIKFENPINSIKNILTNKGYQQPGRKSALQRFIPLLLGFALVLSMKTCFVSPENIQTQQLEKPRSTMQKADVFEL